MSLRPLSAPLTAHDVMLAAHEGEREVLLALWAGLAGLFRRGITRLGRGFALMPGSHSLR